MLRSLVSASDQAKPFLQQAFGRLFTAVLGGGGELTNAQGTFEGIFASIGRGVNVVAGVIETVTPYARAFAYGFLVGLQRVRDSLAPVGAMLSKLFGGASGGEMLVTVFVRLGQGLAVVLAIGAGVVAFLGGVIGFVSAVGVAVVSAGVALIGVYSDLIEAWNSFSFVEVGAQLMAGLAAGITNGLSSVLDSVTSAGQSVIDRVKQVFGIHSPSKVFEELGRYTSEGFQIGVEGGLPGVQGAYQTTLEPSVPATTAAAGGASGGMGGGISIKLGDIVVNARTGANPQEIAAAVREMVTAQLALEIERMATSIGYSPAEA
jgi:phage-related protein